MSSKKSLIRKIAEERKEATHGEIMDFLITDVAEDVKDIIVKWAQNDWYGDYTPEQYERLNRLSNRNSIEVEFSENEVDIGYIGELGYTNAPKDARPIGSNGAIVETDVVLNRIRNYEVWGEKLSPRGSDFLDRAIGESNSHIKNEIDKFMDKYN